MNEISKWVHPWILITRSYGAQWFRCGGDVDFFFSYIIYDYYNHVGQYHLCNHLYGINKFEKI